MDDLDRFRLLGTYRTPRVRFFASLRGPWWEKDRVEGDRPGETVRDTGGW